MKLLYIAPRLHPNYKDSLLAFSKENNLEILVAYTVAKDQNDGLSPSGFPDGIVSQLLTVWFRLKGLAPEKIAYRKRHPSLIWLVIYIYRHSIDAVYARRDNKHLLRTARLAAILTGRRFLTYRQQIYDPSIGVDHNAIYPLSTTSSANSLPVNFIPLSIDLSRLPISSSLEAYYPNSGQPLRVMAVGKLIERKGHHLLIEAVARLKSRVPVVLSIYGAYSDFHAKEFGHTISQMIVDYNLQDCVKLMPMIEPDQMLKEYSNHHLFVYSGWVSDKRDLDEETYMRANGRCGTRLNSLIEAMACGLPVICASEKHVVGAIENGVNGLIFEKKDANDLAKKIEKIAQMNLTEMGGKSKILVEKYYKASDFPVRFLQLLKDS